MTTVCNGGGGDVGGFAFRNRRKRRIIKCDYWNETKWLPLIIPIGKKEKCCWSAFSSTDGYICFVCLYACFDGERDEEREKKRNVMCTSMYRPKKKKREMKQRWGKNLSLVFSFSTICVRHNIHQTRSVQTMILVCTCLWWHNGWLISYVLDKGLPIIVLIYKESLIYRFTINKTKLFSYILVVLQMIQVLEYCF